jgi:DNA polymerase
LKELVKIVNNIIIMKLTSQLSVIQAQVNSCKKCELYKAKTNYVFSRGNPESKIMIVGEAPGHDEDIAGKPFVGLSGKLLDRAIIDSGFNPEQDIYVCNIVKCRPPGNRKPTPEESDNCIDYLEEQINLIDPKVIITLGNTATENLINTTFGVTKIHGKSFKRKNAKVIPMYHSSFILRNGGSTSNMYQEFLTDIKLAFSIANEEIT